jgi:dihydroorotate dehydrogenase
LFLQESERIHDRTMGVLAWASRRRLIRSVMRRLYAVPELPVMAFGVRFPNPVGLAAGMDKTAEAVPIWEALGFGFCELGSVTRHAQTGNARPRLFRVVEEGALINRMGFNNPGVEAFASSLEGWRARGDWPAHPVGINLGKSRITPLREAAGDYLYSLRRLGDLADFYVVNVSSPNTPDLRKLQDRAALTELLGALREWREKTRPILLKVAPDLGFEALDEILEVAQAHGIAGFVATNTTVGRPAARHAAAERLYSEEGGLSGRPLAARSTEVIRHLYRQGGGTLPIIGVGGVFDANDAWDKITAGATAIEVYTGLVYQGPGIARAIVRGLRRRLAREGLPGMADAVGLNARLP